MISTLGGLVVKFEYTISSLWLAPGGIEKNSEPVI
ncbi:hypothetical protein JCM5805K_2445 [Lactococcus lactis subsp. lactis]|uniref:Uncharacterized protein n=1 Tax=Lactococcus lactis subsp. lactis TaxID=1360 RepID=A0A0B8R516_LACLL|nr:hypothetical protein JCM5805K_1758 [Lactococcus lactis subsp. lactis]GAM81324.1 hypothetical protein JCM5805K_2445 [Lactococcus lactis subsp. lactis]